MLYCVKDALIFCLQHRDERRGLGGIFFDDLNDYDQEMLLKFSTGKWTMNNNILIGLVFLVD